MGKKITKKELKRLRKMAPLGGLAVFKKVGNEGMTALVNRRWRKKKVSKEAEMHC